MVKCFNAILLTYVHFRWQVNAVMWFYQYCISKNM